ncbi:MAG: hypothetical protein EZS28_033924, partial [Streblomastix strix]
MEEWIEELIYKEKDTGMGGKTKSCIQAWKQIRKEDFMNTGFYLRFEDQSSQQKLEENKIKIQFRGTKKEKDAYKKMLKEELEEEIVMLIQQDQVKWWNYTFLIKKPNGTWRKILVASKLNKEIEKLRFQMHGLEKLQQLANKMDYSTSDNLKSALHHITISSQSIPYLASNFNNNNYSQKAIHFGTKHSPIFFAEAIESILRQIIIHLQVEILNYCDDILLIPIDKLIHKTQTIEIMRTLQQFGWSISAEKCETERKQIKIFFGCIWNLREINNMNFRKRKQKMIQALKDRCSAIYKIKMRRQDDQQRRQADQISLDPRQKEHLRIQWNQIKRRHMHQKRNHLMRWQYLTEQQSKNLNSGQGKQGNNQTESLISKIITRILTTDASPQGQGATPIYDNQIELMQHDFWSEKETETTSNSREFKAIYYVLICFEQVIKKMQDQTILIRSDNTTAVQTTTIHIPAKRNSTTDSLSRLFRSGDYTLKDRIIQMICKTWNSCHRQTGSQGLGDAIPQRVQLQMEQSQTIYPPTNTSIRKSTLGNETRQSTGNINSTDLAGTIVVCKTKEFIHQIPFPWTNRQDSRDGTENERQGSKTCTSQCGRLPSGPIADVGIDLLMRRKKMRGFSEEGVNLLFNGQRFNTVKSDFYSFASLQDWLDIERITIDKMMKKDAEAILTEVVAFRTRQNNSVASAKSHKARLTT